MKAIARAACVALFAFAALFVSSWTSGNPGAEHLECAAMSQDFYTEQWKLVDEAMRDGKPRTALELVENIYKRARRDRLDVQIIKSACYRIALRAETNDAGDSLLIADLHDEIRAAEAPVKSVFQSLLASLYWNYYQSNRWEISGRTIVGDAPDADFRTWDASTFFDTTRSLYFASLEPAGILRNAGLKRYSDALHAADSRDAHYRPTLYDVLAHRALEFLQNDETNLPRATAEFEVTTLDAIAPADRFVKHSFPTPDEGDARYGALLIYQSLLGSHLGDMDAEALVDLDLQRLDFARRLTLHEDKDTAWFLEVERLASVHAGKGISGEILFRKAEYLHGKGDLRAANAICESVIARFPDSRGAQNCRSLRSRIHEREIRADAEMTVLPGAPFVIAVTHRNVERAHFIIVEAGGEDFEEWNSYRRSFRERLSDILRMKRLHTWETALPAATDFKPHTVDLRGPELPPGRYLLLCSPYKNFRLDSNQISITDLQSTRLSLQSRRLQRGGLRFFVRDAEHGAPLAGVTISLSTRFWNSGDSRYDMRRLRDEQTDKDGAFTLAPAENRDNVFITLKKGKDVCRVGQSFYSYREAEDRERTRTIFFTDRGLYRPGQTVYFKGIVIREQPAKIRYDVLPDYKTKVVFYDVNRQKIAEQSFTTNKYGSFNGVFTAPAGVLTGQMQIRNENGSVSIRVEEYKRPKFEVSFEQVKEAVALNQRVKAVGKAVSYAGANIDNAEVHYRVLRRARFPYWWWWWRPAPSSPAKEIAHGAARTDAQGAFEVSFDALPDKSIDRKTLPVFTYEVSADVTDINGETHSARLSVSVGYTSVEVSADLPAVMDREAAGSLPLRAANLNGRPQKVGGTALLERLRPPDRVYRARLLSAPDEFLLDEAAYREAFPRDVRDQEANEDIRPVEAVVLNARFGTDDEGADTLRPPSLAPGRYRLTLKAEDPTGEIITVKRFFTVYDAGAKTPPLTTPAMFIPTRMKGEPGEKAAFSFGTSFKDARVLYQVEHRGETTRSEWLVFDREMRSFEIPLEEKHRGGFTVRFSVVAGYRHYSEEHHVHVPWTDKDLSVATSVFRDKLKPGQQEEWRLTIRGDKAEAVSAELVAALYDASLDAIQPFSWPSFSWPFFWSGSSFGQHTFGAAETNRYEEGWNTSVPGYSVIYPRLNLFILERGGWMYGRRYRYMKQSAGGVMAADGVAEETALMAAPPAAMADMKSESREGGDKGGGKNGDEEAEAAPAAEESGGVQPRKNFNETAFFFPTLMTNENGEVILSFTIPEALTRWKLQAFAHTPGMRYGSLLRTAVTQKELMVVPNAPRFFREGDEIVFPAKISNLSDAELSGGATLQLFDAVSMRPLDEAFGLTDATRPFRSVKGSSAVVSWKLRVPENADAVVYRVIAKAGEFSDGEEAPLPVLPNRMLVTETLPLNIRGNQTRDWRFEKLIGSASSKTLRHRKLTLEMTSNPAWYAVQALPYIMEYPYECSEQVFNRFYANSIAAHLVRSNPKIERVFQQWKGTEALVSNLEKNQELKSVLLQETPWVMQGKDESERKRRIALLFDLNGMANTLDGAFRKLEKMQGANGGFPWFPGMPESRYLTQYIVAGFGHLRVLGVEVTRDRELSLLRRAVEYCDRDMTADYERLKRSPGFNPKNDYLGYLSVQYLYARSFFLKQDIAREHREAVEFWLSQARAHWLSKGLMAQGMLALGLRRFGDKPIPDKIVVSLRERSLQSDEMGMYWKQERGWFWYQAPIETQAVLIETFDEIAGDRRSVEEMKIWLLKQKQVQDWKTTVATAEACYALLLRGSDLLASDKLVEVTMGGTFVDPRSGDKTPQAGTGYYTASWSGGEIRPEQGNIRAVKRDDGIAWGAVYWQYFEQLDRITPAATPLQVVKKLYRQTATDKGLVLEPITEKDPLRVGDILKARIEIRVDRDMEYIHLKDMRGAGFEPLNQLSGYRWQGGLGYYEAPKDASVNFFIHWLPKGVHVFEYALRASHQGVFSNGITTIQSMYAPEFASHTQGFVVTVR